MKVIKILKYILIIGVIVSVLLSVIFYISTDYKMYDLKANQKRQINTIKIIKMLTQYSIQYLYYL